jgi:GDSL-like Lipase/Acylhydrolase family
MNLSRRAVLAGGAGVLATHGMAEERMTHIVLLGDSVIDNKSYVGQGPDVAEQLRLLAPKEWEVTRLAMDGAVSSDVLQQLENLPADTTHLVISAGGNDALGESGVLDATAHSVAEALMTLANIQERFRESYAQMLNAAGSHKLPTAVCSIYDPCFPDPLRRRVSALALSVINDVITREAFRRQLTLIDLRVMFANDADFANPIEPSVQGGMKLARAIHHFVSDRPQVVI